MKRLILILTITIFISSSIFSQWVNLKPVSDGNYLTSVYFINDNIGWMAGSDGFITKTENAGEVWQRKESNTNVQLRSIFFVNESVGWCVGDGGTILKSNNGGDIWEIQLNDTIPGLTDVQFIDENKGWTVGSSGTILKTENGGINWEIVDVGITNHLNSLFFVNQLLGFIIGNGGVIMKTVDGGATWEQSFVSGDLLDVTFVNNSVGWISGTNQIQKTTDGGNNWQQIYSGSTITGLHFIDENVGSAITNEYSRTNSLHTGGEIISTTDGGISWTSSNISQWHIWSLNSIFLTNTGVGFVVGEWGTVCITVDSGLTWNLSYSGNGFIGGGITDIDITTQDGINSLIAVGTRAATQGEGSAVQYRPITGTDYWVIDKGILYDPYGGPYLEFINDSVGYAYFAPYALKTYDRGNTWTWGVSDTENKSLDRPTLENGSIKMFFVDENIGFWQQHGYEDPFFLLRTTNSGLNWEYIANQGLSLKSFHFSDENNGIAASDTKIYKTTNAGLNWFEIFNQGGREILFINSFVGFVVGGNGNIFKTTNAGTDWFQVNNSGINEDLNDLFFINENIGYVVGNNGTVLVTQNMGNTWYRQDLGMNHNLHSVIFLDDDIGYIAGGGALLKTENGGGAILNINDFTSSFTVSDNCTNSVDLIFGTAPDATDCYDPAYDIYSPPWPPSGAFDGRFVSCSEGFLKDIRRTNIDSIIVWDVYYQPATGCDPVSFSWSPADLPAEGNFFLIDPTGGTLVNVDMRLDSSYTDLTGLDHLQILFNNYTNTIGTVIADGWNMISLPLDVEDSYYKTLFPNAIDGTLFGFDGSYYNTDSIQTEEGYWLRFNEPGVVEIEGLEILLMELDLAFGWNMIGGPYCDLALSSVVDPGGIIIPGTLFGFDGSYFTEDTIEAGKGYWIRTNASGTVTLGCSPTKIAKGNEGDAVLADLTEFIKVEIEDARGNKQNLYFGGKLGNDVSIESYSLPPIPPTGLFDVRISGGYRLSESDEIGIELQSKAFPLKVKMTGISDGNKEGYLIKEFAGNVEVGERQISDGLEISISNDNVNLLKIQKGSILPTRFVLEQNYPNPFNPVTQIKYGITESNNVELIIFNALGEQVRTLLNETKEAGYYKVEWNGTNNFGVKVGSGIYLYSLRTGNNFSVKKMILLK